MYRSSRQNFFNRNESFTSSTPSASPSRGAVATLPGAPSRINSKQWPPLAKLGRESWPTTVVDVAELNAVRGFITSLASGSTTIQCANGELLDVSLTPLTVVTRAGHPASTTDLAIGKNVRIVFDAPGRSTATFIGIELSQVVGRVDSLNGASFKVLGRDGVLRAIVVGSSTSYVKQGSSATIDDLVVGSYVIAHGTLNVAASALAASVVDIARPLQAVASTRHEAGSHSSFRRSFDRGESHGGGANAGRQ